MKLELTEKTYEAVYTTVKIVNWDKEVGEVEEDIYSSQRFKVFVQGFDRRLRELVKTGWSIYTDDYARFIESPYLGGNADMIGDSEMELIEAYSDGSLRIKFSVHVSATIGKD